MASSTALLMEVDLWPTPFIPNLWTTWHHDERWVGIDACSQRPSLVKLHTQLLRRMPASGPPNLTASRTVRPHEGPTPALAVSEHH
jgi:hypothetical protein